ncbi:MAG: PulJ/GspJ family protein [Pirellulales bacterium]
MIVYKNLGFHLIVRRGMTLTEMLVATAMTLVIMGVVVQLFGMVGKGVSSSRASLDMSMQLRSVAHTLRTDLNGITVETVPPVKVDADSGYLEIIEGSGSDTSRGFKQLTGDIDDILMFTAQTSGKPFVGKFGESEDVNGNGKLDFGEDTNNNGWLDTGLMQSPYAEVVWFCREASSQPLANANPPSTLYNLHRRQLLVMDYVGADPFHGTNAINGSLPAAYETYDVSMRQIGANGTNTLLPNGLADLTKRENRFLHNFSGTVSAAVFPYENVVASLASGPFSGNRVGEDIVLTNVLAFDVRVFDPTAKVKESSLGVAVVPGDPGYSTNLTELASGAYIDMGVSNGGTFNAMNAKSQLQIATYDTWSDHYEFNGLDEDHDGIVDEKNNQIDDDLNGIIDDSNERETLPPYAVPLRGLEARIRIYDNSTRQVRQVTVRHTFVPH